MDWIGTGLTIWAAVPAVIFSVRYGLYSNWRSSYVGVGLMIQSVVFALVLVYTLLLHIDKNLPGRVIFSVLIYFSIGAVYWSQIVIMIRAQRESSTRANFGRRADDVTSRDRHHTGGKAT